MHHIGQEKLASLSVVLQLDGDQRRVQQTSAADKGRLELSLSLKDHAHMFQS